MDEDDQLTFVRHVINSDHWAGNKKRKAASASGPSKAKKAAKAKGRKQSADTWAHIVPGSFSILAPGVGEAESESFLKGKTFVMTGVFPEVGGGDDDSIGVEQLKSMIESFGGKVITRFSKNTSEYQFHLQLLVLMLKRFRTLHH